MVLPSVVVLTLTGAAERFACADSVSPLAQAVTPNLARCSEEGRVFAASLVEEEVHAETAAPLLALMGFDPNEHAISRASYLAAEQGASRAAGERYLSADFVTQFQNHIADAEPGPFRDAERELLLETAATALERSGFRLVPGEGSHHIAVAPKELVDGRVPGPEWMLGRDLSSFHPRVDAHAVALRLAREALESHDVNRVRRDLGLNGADLIWLWGPGGTASLPQPPEGTTVSLVGGDATWRGIARRAGFRLRPAEGSEGCLLAVAEALEEGDRICHVPLGATRRAALQRSLPARIEALEEADAQTVGPLTKLTRSYGARLLVIPDGARATADGRPTADPVPGLLWGPGVTALVSHAFTESGARESGRPLAPGYGLLAYVSSL